MSSDFQPVPSPNSSSVPPEGDNHKKVVRIIVTTGSILVGLGVYSFLAKNWQDLQRPLRIVLIILSIIIPYSIGWYLREVSKLTKIGNALILLGTIIYGAGIFLIAQMYGIKGHLADGLTLWMAGTLLMGWATGLYQLFYCSIILGTIAVLYYPSQIFRIPKQLSPLLVSSLLLIGATILIACMAIRTRRQVPPEVTSKF